MNRLLLNNPCLPIALTVTLARTTTTDIKYIPTEVMIRVEACIDNAFQAWNRNPAQYQTFLHSGGEKCMTETLRRNANFTWFGGRCLSLAMYTPRLYLCPAKQDGQRERVSITAPPWLVFRSWRSCSNHSQSAHSLALGNSCATDRPLFTPECRHDAHLSLLTNLNSTTTNSV